MEVGRFRFFLFAFSPNLVGFSFPMPRLSRAWSFLDSCCTEPEGSRHVCESVRGQRGFSSDGALGLPLCPGLSSVASSTPGSGPQKPVLSVFSEGFSSGVGLERDSSIFSHRGFCTASISLSPWPLENSGLSIVPPMRKGNCNLPSFNVAPESRAMVLVKKPSLVVISAKPR
jgi:hypothetical protein